MMPKRLSTVLPLFLCAGLCVGFAGCSGNDDGSDRDRNNSVGPAGRGGGAGNNGGDGQGSSGNGTPGSGSSGNGYSGSGTPGPGVPPGETDYDPDSDWADQVCIMNSCNSDAECVGCPNDRKLCDLSTHRCVKCLPGQSTTVCGEGKECSQSGACIPVGMDCPTDAGGTPTVACTTDLDCFACDAVHQACDTTSHTCVTCSDTNLFACDPRATCRDGKCLDMCPSPCVTDADCASCGTLANPGNTCNEKTRHCAECSATKPYPPGSGTTCGPQGMCVKVCGAEDKPKGTCASDNDCGGCEGNLTKCNKPINGGDGKCSVPASGCSDIPGKFTVLPEPWSQVTNTCSKDDDCKSVGINLNAGKLLRDMTGLSQFNDAVTHYGMNVCAAESVSLFGKDYACGVCVPCRKDADCKPIKFDPLIDQMLGPIGSMLTQVALKLAFGDAPHDLNMYCQSVLGDYGVCAPCIDYLHACGVTSTTGSTCSNDWECAAGERCNDDGKCEKFVQKDCNGGGTCASGQICSWNGNKYCCREPFESTKTCFIDGQCDGQVCAKNADGKFYCTDPVANCD